MSWDTPNYAVPGLMPVTSSKANNAMSLAPAPTFLDPHVEGDNWVGIPVIGPMTVDGVRPSASLAGVRMIFFQEVISCSELILTNESGHIIIEDEVTWEFSIPEVPSGDFTLKAGSYKWVIETTDADGVVRSLLNGILEVRDPRPD